MWSNKYIGIPYKANGRDNTGLDCWGLARLIYSEQFNITLPSFSTDYDISDDARITELIAQYREGWKKLDTPQEGSLVLFKVLGAETHIGIAISDSQFIHVREGSDVAVERFDSVKWAKRISGHFKYSTGAILNAMPHPLKTERITITIPEGSTLAELYEWINKEYKISSELSKRVHILVNGIVVPETYWSTTNLKATDVVEYRAVPGKDVARMALTLIVAYIAFQVIGPMAFTAAGGTAATATAVAAGPWYAYAAAATASAGAMILGGALVNAIAPIRPPSAAGQPAQGNPQLQFSGASNQFNPYGAIPVVLGKVRLTPPVGASTYITYGDMSTATTDSTSSDTYLNMLLVWGYGPLHIDESSLRIGNTALSEYTNYTKSTISYENTPIDTEIKEFSRLYSNDVTQVYKGIELTYPGLTSTIISNTTQTVKLQDEYYDEAGQIVPAVYGTTGGITYALNDTGWVVHTFATSAETITVSIHYPEGFRTIKLKGDKAGQSFPGVGPEVVAQIRKNTGTANTPVWGAWGAADTAGAKYYLNPTGTDAFFEGAVMSGDAFTTTHNIRGSTVPFEIRVRRLGVASGDTADGSFHSYNKTILQTITTYNNISDVLIDPPNSKIAKTAINIKATDQLNSQVEGINALVQTITKVWNGSNWDTSAATSNPAALFYYILCHPANPQRILSTEISSKINLTALGDWYTYCVTNGFEHNAVLGTQRSVLDVLRDICAAGRGSPALVDGKWTVLIDRPKDYVIQHFTTHNSWGFESTKVLPKFPDGLKVQFYDETNDYEQKELIVYAANKGPTTAELFESIQLPGVTNSAAVEKHARWHYAQMKLRPEIYTLNSDIEYLVCNRGDRVKVTHDVPMWGLGSGRIKNRVSPSVYELDEDVPIKVGSSYTIRVRSDAGNSTTAQVKTSFNIQKYSVINNVVTLTISDTITKHPLVVGDIVNITATGLTSPVAIITSVADTTISYSLTRANAELQNITGTVTLNDNYYSKIQVLTDIDSTNAQYGDLFLYGELNKESQDLIVLSIEPTGSAKSARLTLVDYGVSADGTSNIFTGYEDQTNPLKFLSNITLPPTLLIDSMGTAKPLITTANIKSDESVMELISPGVFRYRLNVPYTVSTDVPSTVVSVEGQINFYSSGSELGSTSEIVVFDNGTISFTDVQEGVRYKVRLRYVGKDGRTGQWTDWVDHKVIGKSTPPSNVSGIGALVSETAIKLSWTQCPEIDYASTMIKYYVTGDTTHNTWDTANLLFEGNANTYDWVRPITNNYSLLLRHKDTSGNLSTSYSPLTITYTQIELASIRAELSNPNPLVPADNDGSNPTLTGSGTEVRLYEGNTLLKYDATSTANGYWRFTKSDSSGLASGLISDSGDYATVGILSSFSNASLGVVTYTITGKSSLGFAISKTVLQQYTKAKAGAKGNTGDTGSPGGTGSPGETGATGAQVFTIYIRTESSAIVPSIGATSYVGGVLPTGGAGSGATTTIWQLNAFSPLDLTGSQAQWQCDGKAAAGSNTIYWGTPYLSYFKVGSLEAITANLGLVTAGAVYGGSMQSNGSWPSSAATGNGYYVGLNGIRFGNNTKWAAGGANNGSYFEVNLDGSIGTPRFRIDASGNVDIKGADFTTGTSPTISGTTMTGSGAVIKNDGTFALGGTTSNITGSGAAIYLNGEVINTPNIKADAVTKITSQNTVSGAPPTAGLKFADFSTTGRSLTMSFTILHTKTYLPLNGVYPTYFRRWLEVAIWTPTGGYVTAKNTGYWDAAPGTIRSGTGNAIFADVTPFTCTFTGIAAGAYYVSINSQHFAFALDANNNYYQVGYSVGTYPDTLTISGNLVELKV